MIDKLPAETIGPKLDPRRFTAMSPKMAALLAFILGPAATWTTEPRINEINITSDGFVLASHSGDIGANDMIGDVSDLRRNLVELAAAVELTRAERSLFNHLLTESIDDHRRGSTAVQIPL